MNIFDFETRLKNDAAKSRGAVDMDRLLSDLDIKPQARSHRRYIYFFTAGIVLLGLGYLTSTHVFNSETNQSQMNATLIETESETNSINNETETKTIINKTPLSENKTTITTPKNNDTSSSKTNISKLSRANTLPTSTEINNESYNIDIPQNSTTSRSVNKTLIQDNTINSAKVIEATSSESKIIAAAYRNLATKNNSLVNTTKANTKKTTRLHEPVGLLPTSAVSLLTVNDKITTNKGTNCPQFGDRLWHMYLIPELGYTFPLKTLTLTDDDFRFVFTERLAHESAIEGINASLSLQFKNQITGLYVKPGFSYSRFTERIDFVRREIVGYDTSFITIIVDGVTTIEEVLEPKDKVSREEVHYQLHQFELPIAIGYSVDFNKFAIDLEAGIRFNFLQKATGRILTNESDFIDVASDNVDLFKSSVGLGFFGGVMFKGQINSRTALYVGPRFSFNTLSYSSNSNPITQRYNVAGLHAGLIYVLR